MVDSSEEKRLVERGRQRVAEGGRHLDDVGCVGRQLVADVGRKGDNP